MTNAISTRIQPLTPLWTGDANSNGSSVRETGVLGSLRWWYELLLRGLGYYACDPTSGTCGYDDQKKFSAICLACQVFGCTGFSRRFRLKLDGGGDAGQPKEIKLKSPGTQKHRGWRIPTNLTPPFRLTFLPMARGGLGELERGALFHTLGLIERYGTLGAKTSYGQGVVKVADQSDSSTVPSLEGWKTTLEQCKYKTGKNPSPAPNLADFMGATIILDSGATSASRWWDKLPLTGLNAFGLNDESTWVPSAPAVRAWLREWLRDQANFPSFSGNLGGERHRLMGVVQGQNTRGANIFVTHLYRVDAESPWTMRIFGFVPKDGNEVDQAVHGLLSDGQKLAGDIKTALGVGSVTATPYPNQLAGLLEASRGASQ